VTPASLILLGVAPATLSGEQYKLNRVPFTLSNVLSTSAQAYAEEYFKSHSWVFPILVKSDNQLQFAIFNSASSNPRAPVVMGEQGHLIERIYIQDANRIAPSSPKQLRQIAERIKRLQEHLTAREIEFVIVISPNKPSFYPEIIPQRYRVPGATKRFDARSYFVKQLKRRGVRHIDAFSLLKEKEQELRAPMFSPIGTHWNELGGCIVASEILRQTQDVQGRERMQFSCSLDGQHPTPPYHDSDLLRLANVWLDSSFMKPTPRVARTVLPHGLQAQAPRLLMIGSSFCWELMRQFEQSGATSAREFLYYFHRRTRKAEDRGVNFDRSRYNVERELKNRDIVVIEINQAVLLQAGFGFPEKVLGE
jgi:hypothetical protein